MDAAEKQINVIIAQSLSLQNQRQILQWVSNTCVPERYRVGLQKRKSFFS